MSYPDTQCEQCGEDMTYDTCPNYKAICIDCCIESGDVCGHHQCNSECQCGHRGCTDRCCEGKTVTV